VGGSHYAGIHAMGLLKGLRYDVMVSCWKLEAGERPKFSDSVVTVNDLLEKDAGYLELSRFPTLTVATRYIQPPHLHLLLISLRLS
jgi:hypothetical protein